MLNLFGLNKNNSSNKDDVNIRNDVNSKYSIHIDIKGKIHFISFGLKEYFLINDIYDVTKVLPDNLSELCQSLIKSKQTQIIKCEYSKKAWVWEFSAYDKNTIMIKFLNNEDFERDNRTESNEDADQLNEEIYGSVPASICVTAHETFQVIFANDKYHEMFKTHENSYNDLTLLINNKEILRDIHLSLQDSNEVENVLFVISQSGESFWQNSDRYISVTIQRSKLIFGDVLVWKFEDI